MTEPQPDASDTGDASSSHVKCEVKTWHLLQKEDGTEEKTSVEGFGHVEPSTDHFALVVTRKMDKNRKLESTTMHVNSPYILQAFRDVVKSHPTIPSDFSSSVDIPIPSEMLFHHWDGLQSYCDGLEDDAARSHVALLLKFMEFDMGAARKSYTAQVRSGLVEFARLGILFRPGDTVVTYVKAHPWLLKVDKTAYETHDKRGKYCEIQCSYSDYDGEKYGVSKHVFRIYQREDFGSDHPSKILELKVFPRVCAPDDADLEARLRERGQLFLSITGVMVRQYDGPAQYLKLPPLSFFHPEEDDWKQLWMPFTETGRVIIDRKTFEQDHPSGIISKRPLESLDTALCSPFVLGFSCSRKDWCRFYVTSLSPVPWKSHAFDQLILPQSQLNLVRALVTSHTFPTSARDEDQQKGKGLVCLLHGPPGSGKTLTAECAAETTQKALIRASISELNKHDSPWFFEFELTRVLRLATTWKAIVLLDEADVFLEARGDDSHDASNRNALVAVFLRHLEYFSGICFLTTNRIAVFDAAMKSRVHLALGYQEPDQQARRLIWKQSLDKKEALLLDDGGKEVAVDDAAELMSTEALNGREISNAIHTASTLARYAGEPLALSHINEVLGVKRDFEVSLQKMKKDTLGHAPIKHNSIID
ncbi:P-loop containing nucleoside triphosphate hydrolase protein [Aureobasidium sp. EXF-10727]|nr:P-loop containing nucleoside triphosphate hydrolase protein [Aureobasidium sp. EXF-10727]